MDAGGRAASGTSRRAPRGFSRFKVFEARQAGPFQHSAAVAKPAEAGWAVATSLALRNGSAGSPTTVLKPRTPLGRAWHAGRAHHRPRYRRADGSDKHDNSRLARGKRVFAPATARCAAGPSTRSCRPAWRKTGSTWQARRLRRRSWQSFSYGACCTMIAPWRGQAATGVRRRPGISRLDSGVRRHDNNVGAHIDSHTVQMKHPIIVSGTRALITLETLNNGFTFTA